MSHTHRTSEAARIYGFHEGEHEVQARAGLQAEAARLEGMLAPAALAGGSAMFLASQTFAVLAGHDHTGTLWASPLTGHPGFLEGQVSRLAVAARPSSADPLTDIAAGQAVAVIAVDTRRRRRVRVNGWLSSSTPDGFEVEVEEAYGNCPSYIQQRSLRDVANTSTTTNPIQALNEGALVPQAVRAIRSADTFFLATEHVERGADISHKGGNPGFVRTDGKQVWWPDYAGNNMFNSLGNLASNPAAALMFIDFTTGMVLQLSGFASLEFEDPDTSRGDASTGRWVRFVPQAGYLHGSGLRGGAPSMSPHNPPVTE